VKAALLGLTALLLVGCAPAERPIPTARGEARVKVFRECMELAGRMPRQADDDVADVVQQCGDQSYYLTNYIQ
jgi:hypothetical protein